ncbi:MAG: hypothetical protein HQM12_20350 [SAR324 cluster bacterium]|nr:hypothetical protein [SAR324 cluster bacterium]
MSVAFSILYQGTLVAESPLLIAQGKPEGLTGIMELRTDGSDCPVIPGTSLAGVFFEDLEWQQGKMSPSPHEHFQGLSGKLSRSREEDSRSALIFASSPLQAQGKSLAHWRCVRDRIRMDEETRTVAEGAKFAQWQLITGSRFEFQLEIEPEFLNAEAREERLQEIEQVLLRWQNHGFFLGHSSGSGNGWMRLENLQKWEVTASSYQNYLQGDPFEMRSLFQSLSSEGVQGSTRFNYLPYEVNLQPDSSAWGLDFVEIHQGSQYSLLSEMDAPFYSEKYFVSEPSMNFQEYYILPGSSLRGAMRSFLRDYYPTEWIHWWFGAEKDSKQDNNASHARRGWLRFRDARGPRVPKQSWLVHAHAEDEFTASTYESGLFDHCPLVEAVFEGRLAYPKDFEATLIKEPGKKTEKTEAAKKAFDEAKKAFEELPKVLDFFFQQAGKRRVVLGGGGGHPSWKRTETQEAK